MRLKEVEQRLPKKYFVRISRSHIINKAHITSIEGSLIYIKDNAFKVGKVYKRFAEEYLEGR
jgi:DNA-binding LytR/AlgR family response regulator